MGKQVIYSFNKYLLMPEQSGHGLCVRTFLPLTLNTVALDHILPHVCICVYFCVYMWACAHVCVRDGSRGWASPICSPTT